MSILLSVIKQLRTRKHIIFYPKCCSHVFSPELFFTRVKLFYYNSTFISNVIISKYFVSDIT